MLKFALPVWLFMIFALTACGGSAVLSSYSGPQYPETAQVKVLFQTSQVRPSCRVFAELLAFFPADVSAQTIQTVLEDEARARGAHVLLIGQSRASRKDEGLYLMYLGPQREYAMDSGWNDWAAGYSIWKKQLGWVQLGHGEWRREDVVYSVPIAMQAAMLRCH